MATKKKPTSKKKSAHLIKAAAYKDALKALNEFKSKHQKVLFEYTELLNAFETATEELKEATKAVASDEESEVVINTPELRVEIRPVFNPAVFSVALAKKYWPKEAYEAARTTFIDYKVVQQLAHDGVLGERELEKAVKEEPTLKHKSCYITTGAK